MKKYRITEIICLASAVVFIWFSLVSLKGTDKNAEEIASALLPLMDDSTLTKRGVGALRKAFDFNTEAFCSFSYYSSDDVMDVNEILVLVLKDNSGTDEICEKLKRYAGERYAVYNGYAAMQAELLDNYVLKVKGNALLFCIGKEAGKALGSFVDSL